MSRRRAFVCVAFAFAVAMLGTTLPTPLYPIYREEFDFSNLTITVIFALYAAGVIAALLLFGNLSDAIGRRRALLPGLALSAASAVVFLLADGAAAALRRADPLRALGRDLHRHRDRDPGRPGARRARPSGPPSSPTVVNIGGLGLRAAARRGPRPVRRRSAHARLRRRLCPARPGDVGIWLMAEPIEGAASRPLRIRADPPRRAAVGRGRPSSPPSLAGLRRASPCSVSSPRSSPRSWARCSTSPTTPPPALVVLAAFGSSALGQIAGRGLSAARALPGGCALLIAGMALLVLGLQEESLAGLDRRRRPRRESARASRSPPAWRRSTPPAPGRQARPPPPRASSSSVTWRSRSR